MTAQTAVARERDTSPSLKKPAATLPAFMATGRTTLAIREGVSVSFADGGEALIPAAEIELPELVVGTDYAVILHGDGKVAAIASRHSSSSGADLVLGGFHFAPGGNASARSGGDDVPTINPYSIWDINFRPACSDPSGMTLVDGQEWVDIYLTPADHIGGTSRFGMRIADGRDLPNKPDGGAYARCDHAAARAVLAHHGKHLLTPEGFFRAAYGVTERSVASGDPVVTGLDAPRTSKWGLMQATGNMWIHGTDGDPDDPRPAIFGGSWFDGGHAGSRCAVLGTWADGSGEDLGLRGRCDHLVTV